MYRPCTYCLYMTCSKEGGSQINITEQEKKKEKKHENNRGVLINNKSCVLRNYIFLFMFYTGLPVKLGFVFLVPFIRQLVQ